MDGDVPLSTPYVVYISQLTRFVRVCGQVAEFNELNQILTKESLNNIIDIRNYVNQSAVFYRETKLVS